MVIFHCYVSLPEDMEILWDILEIIGISSKQYDGFVFFSLNIWSFMTSLEVIFVGKHAH